MAILNHKHNTKTRGRRIVTALAATSAVASSALGQATNAPVAKDGMISLVGTEPAINYAFRRNLEFYGDPNTEGGNPWDRTQLTGNWGSLRDQATDHGVYFDASLTQFLQGNVSGGNNQGPARYNGSADYWLTLDN